jgi:hypothetical protein
MFDELRNGCVRLLHVLMSASKLTYASVGVGLLVAFLYFKIFFQDASQFEEDAKNTARLEYMRRRSYVPFGWLTGWTNWFVDKTDYQWSELKIIIWIGLSVVCGVLAYYQLPEWFPNVFR